MSKTFTQIRMEMQILWKGEGWSQRRIAGLFDHITRADVSRILKGVEPRDPHKRLELDLPALDLAPVCPVHQVVHVGKCPGKRKAKRDLFAYSKAELAQMIRERK